jgi:hypothetical protein
MGRMSMAIAMARRNQIHANFPAPDREYARRPNGFVCSVCVAEGKKCPRCASEDRLHEHGRRSA